MSADEPDDGPPDGIADGVALQVRVVRERLVEDRPWDLVELAGRAGVDADVAERLFRAASRLRADDGYGRSDLAYLETAATILERLPLEQLERQARLRARTLSSLAIADLRQAQLAAAIREGIAAGVPPDELGELMADTAEVLLPAAAELIAADYRDQVVRLLDSDVVERASRDLGAEIDLAVGFIDLVGFTELSAAADPDGVGRVLDAFEGLVGERAADVGEVMATKTLGDAVMLVSGDCDKLATVLLDAVLAEDVSGLEDVARRAGMAVGDVQVRDGDYVGTVVNTAARLTDLAHPGSLVITHDAWDRMTHDRWDTSLLPPKRLKGLGTSRPLRLRHAGE